MTTQPQTAATGSDGPAKTAPEDKGAQGKGDDLDSILSEIEAEGKADDTPKKGAVDPAPDKGKQDDPDIRTLVKSIHQREARRDLKTAIGSMRSDNEALTGLSDDYIESLMNAEARRDPRILRAWSNREGDPATWERVLPVLGKKIAKALGGLVDTQTTEDREAVLTAVRNKSPGGGGGSDQPDFVKMSDAEFTAYKRSLMKRR